MEFGSVDWKRWRVKVRISPDFGLRGFDALLSVHSSSAVEEEAAVASARNRAVVVPQERPMLARRVADGTTMLLLR